MTFWVTPSALSIILQKKEVDQSFFTIRTSPYVSRSVSVSSVHLTIYCCPLFGFLKSKTKDFLTK